MRSAAKGLGGLRRTVPQHGIEYAAGRLEIRAGRPQKRR